MLVRVRTSSSERILAEARSEGLYVIAQGDKLLLANTSDLFIDAQCLIELEEVPTIKSSTDNRGILIPKMSRV